MSLRRRHWFLALFWFGCSVQAAVVPPKPMEVYERAGQRFPAALFFKPAESPASGLAYTLAPLLLQAAAPPEPGAAPGGVGGQDAFGALVASNRVLTIDRSQPTVYYEADALELGGTTHARFSYVWCYRASGKGPGGLSMQGVRITLDSGGNPVVWEVLSDSSGLGIIFAAQSLEQAARAEFGPPLPGRRFALERALPEARETVVARVIEDGPVPMGPIVYLGERSHAVTTLICRCMPAQAGTLLDSRVYSLAPALMAPRESDLTQARHRSGLAPAFWPGAKSSHRRLEKVLRLPARF